MQKDFLDFNDLSLTDWEQIYNLAEDIYNRPGEYTDRCKNKILATLFYEPSTRTRFSTQSAMYKLGGNSIGFSQVYGSSVVKGESLKDTVKMVESYSDIIAIRHPKDGAAAAAALYSRVPVINAGDGKHLHPTQTLLDLFTIGKYKGFTGLNIGICGDLLNGRTAHSLLRAFDLYPGNNFYLISSPDFKMPESYLENKNIIINESINDCISELDIIYITLLQRERIDGTLAPLSDALILNKSKLINAKKDLLIMHPLPRNEEISTDIDEDPRAAYFKQAEFGLYIRMALLIILLEGGLPPSLRDTPLTEGGRTKASLSEGGVSEADGGSENCPNANCIINDKDDTSDLPRLINKDGTCAYCGIKIC